MKIALIAFTDQGRVLGHSLASQLTIKGDICDTAGLRQYANREKAEADSLKKGYLEQWVKQAFEQSEALVFIAATGIAVRAIAPHLNNKMVDPAVIVIDDRATWVISLVSGHLGGANELTRQIAKLLGAQAVITTATDVNGVFAVDLWAKSQNLTITSTEQAKKISAALLRGETIGFQCDYPWSGSLPRELQWEAGDSFPLRPMIRVSAYCFQNQGCSWKGNTLASERREDALWLVPKSVVVGIGCRKGTTDKAIEKAIIDTFSIHGLSLNSITSVATIDLKKDEEGLLAVCNQYRWRLYTYSAGQLMQAEGEFTPSQFVSRITGADNVCERAAVLAAQGGRVLIPKTCCHQVTVAAAEIPTQLKFV